MKTTINQTTKSFRPIELTIRLDTVEELKQFLLLSSNMTDSDAYSDRFLEESPINLSDGYENETHALSDDLASFVEEMVSVDQWRDLRTIYIEHTKENK